jgi:hypothetical protein
MVAHNASLHPQYGQDVHIRPDLRDTVNGDGGGQAGAVRQLRMSHRLHADLAGVGRFVNPVWDVTDLAEERRRPPPRLKVSLVRAVHSRPVV